MLIFGTRFQTGPLEVTFDLAIDRQVRLFTVERRGTMWDTRYVPPLETPRAETAMVYFLLDGHFLWRGPDEQRFEGPSAFVLTEEQLDGSNGARPSTVRSWGSPYGAIEMRVAATSLTAQITDGPIRLELPDRVWSAARVYASSARGLKDQASRVNLVLNLLKAMHEEKILTTDLASTVVADEGVRQHLWNAVAPFVRDAYFSPTLDEVAGKASLSLKQVSRQVDKLMRTFDVPPFRWRGLTRRYRIRVAILVLSNPEVPIAEVARISGYSSAEALTHALYAEGLPSPTELRARILNPN